MVIVEVCVGSSCYLKGSEDLVSMMQQEIAKDHLENDVVLTGRFCAGKCNRVGVTITVGDQTYVGVTKEGFKEFWTEKVLPEIRKDHAENN